jgi:alkylhydroperoxidase family enzyme
VKLTSLIGLVNAWNRINIGFRSVHPAEAKNAA